MKICIRKLLKVLSLAGKPAVIVAAASQLPHHCRRCSSDGTSVTVPAIDSSVLSLDLPDYGGGSVSWLTRETEDPNGRGGRECAGFDRHFAWSLVGREKGLRLEDVTSVGSSEPASNAGGTTGEAIEPSVLTRSTSHQLVPSSLEDESEIATRPRKSGIADNFQCSSVGGIENPRSGLLILPVGREKSSVGGEN
ncbi:hypothetical protein R1sor_026283 [Riccia sorocarpa]|uniref:Uncharacterized protein n=1 Tax=Riccia sorocarpa TaxID=122646 RepID=A0ABD3GB03_9MARC